ncbi:MAG: ChaN family lipoprotein [Bacteroidota bacterium]|nr:ChaN family lipoprotein [Bacteroidota bacterium]
MKRITLLILPLVILLMAFTSDKEAYQIYSAKGQKVKYKALKKAALEADIILFGELHNDPICHWLQYELTKDLFEIHLDKLLLGAEMFETDNQLLLDEYISGKISEKSFKNEARLWPNYDTDYEVLVEFARENQLEFIATNVPRRYASVVHKQGFEGLDSLSIAAKRLLPPLPVTYDPELKCYKDMLEMMEGMGGHASDNFPKAQAIKDATMAYNILKNWYPQKVFLHYNGTYHSNNREGITWYLMQEKPTLNILTIATVEQAEIDNLDEEYFGLATYIICVPEDMTKTH